MIVTNKKYIQQINKLIVYQKEAQHIPRKVRGWRIMKLKFKFHMDGLKILLCTSSKINEMSDSFYLNNEFCSQ